MPRTTAALGMESAFSVLAVVISAVAFKMCIRDRVCAAAQVIQHRADHARGAVGTDLEQIACQAGGAAGHALPQLSLIHI